MEVTHTYRVGRTSGWQLLCLVQVARCLRRPNLSITVIGNCYTYNSNSYSNVTFVFWRGPTGWGGGCPTFVSVCVVHL